MDAAYLPTLWVNGANFSLTFKDVYKHDALAYHRAKATLHGNLHIWKDGLYIGRGPYFRDWNNNISRYNFATYIPANIKQLY